MIASLDLTRFFADLHADLERSLVDPPVFASLTPEQDRALDRLLAMVKPHFERALAKRIASGVFVRPKVEP